MRTLRLLVVFLLLVALGALAGTCWLVGTGWSEELPPTHQSLSERFVDQRHAFETLRDIFSEDREADAARQADPVRQPTWDVRTDCYSWVDPCDSCGERGAGNQVVEPGWVNTSGRAASAPCDYVGGCLRWVDEPPTPEVLAQVRPFGVARARSYLDAMEALGVVWLRARDLAPGPARPHGTSSIEFVVDMRGTMLSGSSTAIAWAPDPEQRHSSDVPIESAPGWFVRVSH